jgi:hypothetical protein
VSLPNFVYVGAAKAGSTWLYAALGEHPEVFIPTAKRTYFFDRYYECGSEWYSAHFRPNRQQRAVGEICHDYFLDRKVAGRIKQTIPNAKVICCLRNPAERLVSAFIHEREHGHIGAMTFDEFVASDAARRKNDYVENLRPFYDVFEQDQLLVLLYDDLCAAPEAFYARVCRFLGIDDTFVPSVIAQRVNATRKVRFPGFAKNMYKNVRAHDPSNHAATWRNRLRAQLMRALEPLLYTNVRAKPPAEALKSRVLNRQYEGSYPELERLTGVTVPRAWYG